MRGNGCLGRDHWPDSMCALVSGGGLRMGQVVGSTNARGEYPKDRRVGPEDMLATLYHVLGIDTTLSFADKSGRPHAIEDPKFLASFLERLIAKNESYEKSQWNLSKVPEAYKAGLITGIVALEMDIELLEGKFKLGLDAPPGDQEKLLAGLKSAANERTLYEFTKERAALAAHR